MDITNDTFIRHVTEDDPDAIEPDDITDPDEDNVGTYSTTTTTTTIHSSNIGGFDISDFFNIFIDSQ